MNNNYNYYPRNNYSRMDYNEFINSLGVSDGNIDPNFNMNVAYNNNMPNNIDLFGSYEGYSKGNMFKGLYDQYKNYTPNRLVPTSEQEEALLNLNQMQFAMHEANLYLDVFPNDQNMMREYIKFRNSYNNLLREYQSKYSALSAYSDNLNQNPFGWEEETFPWDRRGL